jgi:transposase
VAEALALHCSPKKSSEALVDDDGKLVARKRVPDDAAGWKTLLELFAEHGDTPQNLISVAIETGRGLLVACLWATGRTVYAINPRATSPVRPPPKRR